MRHPKVGTYVRSFMARCRFVKSQNFVLGFRHFVLSIHNIMSLCVVLFRHYLYRYCVPIQHALFLLTFMINFVIPFFLKTDGINLSINLIYYDKYGTFAVSNVYDVFEFTFDKH